MKTRVCVCVRVCGGGVPRAPPPCPPSNQSTERPLGPRDHGAAAAAAGSGVRRRWGRVTCVHTVELSSTPAVVMPVTVGPLSDPASSEKLIDAKRNNWNPLKRVFPFPLFYFSRAQVFFFPYSNETTEKCQWKCYIKTQCLPRVVTDPSLYVCGEFSSRFHCFISTNTKGIGLWLSPESGKKWICTAGDD